MSIHILIFMYLFIYIHTGYMLANGWGVDVDVTAAVSKFERAVELGESGGWVGLGISNESLV